jgi:cell wall-associated NlpC family hydrolase
MTTPSLVRAALAIAALPLAAPFAAAQSHYEITPFVSSNTTMPGPSALYGGAVAVSQGPFGVRVGGALATTARPSDGAMGVTRRVGAYTADVDGVLDASAIPGLSLLLGGFVPQAFAGVGVEGGRAADSASWSAGPVLSYGVGVSRAILGGIGVSSEARYRVPTALDGGATPSGLRKGWEYRLGLSIGFGGRSRSGGGGILGWPVATGSRRGRGSSAPASASAAKVLSTADRYVGTRYVYGGSTPEGFDCSGFVQYVYRKQGVELPRTSRQQGGAGERVSPSLSSLRPGDLMLFDASDERAGIDHVAIYAGGSRMIHATSSGGGVRYDDLTTARGEWFLDHMVAARRVVSDGRSLVGELDAALRAQSVLDPPDHAPRP